MPGFQRTTGTSLHCEFNLQVHHFVFSRRLKRKFPDLSEGDIILRESQRLEKILQRIMKYLRPMEFTYGDCSVKDVLTECLEILGPDMEHGV